MKTYRLGMLAIICLAALISVCACTVKNVQPQPNAAGGSEIQNSGVVTDAPADSKAPQTEAPQTESAAADDNEALVVDFFRCIDEERFDDLAKLIAPEERAGYEAIAALADGDRTGVRNISSAAVKEMTPYELTDSMIFAKTLEKYAEADGARAAYRVKLDMSVYDENGAFADETGETEQLVLLVKNGEEWFVGFWGLVNE